MRFSTSILALIPLTFALPSPELVKRAPDLAPQILGKIAELNTAVGGLTTAVNNFDGSLLGVIPQSLAVVSAELKLDATTVVTTFITKQSSNFTAAESQNVVSSLAGLIGPIQSSLSALSTKKTLEAPIVLLDLKVLKAHTDDLINAVTVKVTPDSAGLLGFGKGIIDQAFNSAIAVYSGS